jgi:hypothetical protein
MPRVATFCPRCGESIDTQLPEEAKTVGRAELTCPACRFRFVIAPARPPQGESEQAAPAPAESPPGLPPDAPPGEAPRHDKKPDTETTPGAAGAGEPGPPAAQGPTTLPQATQARKAHQGPSGSLPARLLSAGLLLFFAAAIGLFYAIVFSNAPGIFDEALEGPAGTGEMEGIVVTPDRNGVEGARVYLLQQVEEGQRPDLETGVVANTTTDAEGRYQLAGIDPGVHWLRIEMDGHRTTFFQTWAFTDEGEAPGQPDFGTTLWEVVLRPGAEDDVAYQTQQVTLLETMLRVFQISGWIAYPASILAAIAGVFILVRRSFAFSVVGAVAGMLAVGFLVGGAMALVALILVLTARREFTPMGKSKSSTPQDWQ